MRRGKGRGRRAAGNKPLTCGAEGIHGPALFGELPEQAFFRCCEGGKARGVLDSDAELLRNRGEAFPYEFHAVGDIVFSYFFNHGLSAG